jgi:hypothetical protein
MLAQLNLDEIQRQAIPGIGSRFGSSGLGGIVSAILPWVFGLAGFALLVYLILGGLQFMTSQGDPKAMQAAQAKITNALIGFGVIILASAIVMILGEVFKIEIFSDIFRSGVFTPGR